MSGERITCYTIYSSSTSYADSVLNNLNVVCAKRDGTTYHAMCFDDQDLTLDEALWGNGFMMSQKYGVTVRHENRPMTVDDFMLAVQWINNKPGTVYKSCLF